MAAAKRKPATKKSDPEKDIADRIVGAIKDGKMDGFLVQLDDALTERMNAQVEAQASSAPKKETAAKKVAPPPKKSASKQTAVVKPVKDTEYVVADTFKRLATAVVSFVRHKDGDTAKSVVAMVSDMPGAPKGKRVVVPTNALLPKPATPAKKSASRKVARKK
jgi:hypothetical protein